MNIELKYILNSLCKIHIERMNHIFHNNFDIDKRFEVMFLHVLFLLGKMIKENIL